VRKFLQRCTIRKIARDARRNPPDRSLGRRVEETEPQAKRITRQGQHVTKLSAAQNADAHALDLFFVSFAGFFF
jgi:hypothetical protein